MTAAEVIPRGSSSSKQYLEYLRVLCSSLIGYSTLLRSLKRATPDVLDAITVRFLPASNAESRHPGAGQLPHRLAGLLRDRATGSHPPGLPEYVSAGCLLYTSPSPRDTT